MSINNYSQKQFKKTRVFLFYILNIIMSDDGGKLNIILASLILKITNVTREGMINITLRRKKKIEILNDLILSFIDRGHVWYLCLI